MRIGVDGRVLTDRYPGIGRALFAVLPALAGCDDEIVLIRGPEPRSSRFPAAALEGVDIEQCHVTVGLRSASEHILLPGFLRRLRLDVILTPYFASALRWPCPRVTMVHDQIPLTVPGSMPSAVQRFVYRWWLRAAVEGSRIILAPSRATADDLELLAPRKKSRIRVVPHALDPRFLPSAKDRSEEVRARYGLGPRYLLVVAGDRPHKNLGRLVAAWTALGGADREDAVLALAGEPPPRVEHPTVRVLGSVCERDLPALYSGADAAVVPSLAEGFGLPLAEAMACGTAVACSDRPALVEFAGDAALLFDPECLDSIRGALTRLLGEQDLRASLAQRGLRRAVRLAPGLVAARLLEAVRTAAGQAT